MSFKTLSKFLLFLLLISCGHEELIVNDNKIVPERNQSDTTKSDPLNDEEEEYVISYKIEKNDSFAIGKKFCFVYNPYKDKPKNQYKGQMHCHSTNSDGSFSPEYVVNMYIELGYDFMTLTDHNYISSCPNENADIVWLGNAYEDTHNIKGFQHMNVYNCNEPFGLVAPSPGEKYITPDGYAMIQTSNTPQSLVDHFTKTYATDETLQDLPDSILYIEIWNGVSTKIDRGFRIMLDSGKKVFCNAIDDFHSNTYPANRGWMKVFAKSKTRKSIWNGLLKGASYASCGVELNDVNFENGVFSIDVQDGTNATTTFYGKGNQVLAEIKGEKPYYKATGNETYIRAMVVLNGKMAWTQPVWVLK